MKRGNRMETDGAVARIYARRRSGADVAILVDANDVPALSAYTWSVSWSASTRSFVARTHGPNGVLIMSRFLLGAPRGVEVDHRNHDTLDNRRANLRPCTVAENRRNRARHHSGYKGVTKNTHGPSWQARIVLSGKLRHLGSYHTPEDAALAYDDAARRHFGEFAYPNFPDGTGAAGRPEAVNVG